MSALDLETDREAFRRHAVESDRCAAVGDEAAARAQSDRCAEIADWWEQHGCVASFLAPLLASWEPRAVRFDAASWLLHCGYPAIAVPVLEDLSSGGDVEAADAALLLDDWWEHRSQHPWPGFGDPLFVTIAGLVSEVGGMMTHGAIVARGVLPRSRRLADLLEQVGANGLESVDVRQTFVGVEGAEQRQPGFGSVYVGEGYGTVESDHRPGRDLFQYVVESEDLWPVADCSPGSWAQISSLPAD